MKRKSVKIRKQNELIRGKDGLSLFGKRCFNSIYYLIQTNLNNNPDLLKAQHIIFKLASLKKLMNLEKVNNYIDIIKESLKELQRPIELNNFKHPDGTNYSWYSFSPLNDVGFTKNENDEWIVKIELSTLTKFLIEKKENYTTLELLPYLNKMRTKYAMKLYEYLKSFEKYRYIDITHEHIIKLFNLNPKSRYKYFSKTKELLERQIKEIREKTDLRNLKMIEIKENKTFRFLINPKSKHTLKNRKKIEEMINNITKKF